LYFITNIWDDGIETLTPGATALTAPAAPIGGVLIYGIDQLTGPDTWLLVPGQGIWTTNNTGRTWKLITKHLTPSPGTTTAAS
jgi:hypothetical protein